MTVRVRLSLLVLLLGTGALAACGGKNGASPDAAASGQAPSEDHAAPGGGAGTPAAPAPAPSGGGAAAGAASGAPGANAEVTPPAGANPNAPKIPLPIQIGDKTIVARVNGTEIVGHDLNRAFVASWRQFLRNGVALPMDMQQQVMTELLQAMIGSELLRQQATKDGLKVEPAALDEQYRKIVSGAPNEEEFKKALQNEGLTPDTLRAQISARMLADAYVDKIVAAHKGEVTVTDADAKQFYQSNPKMFERMETVRARHILRRFPQNATEPQKKAERAKIEEALAKIKAGEDFAKVASTYSSDVTAAKGGDLGFFPRGKMVPQFEDVAFSQKPGEVSGVVETRYGYHIIKTEEKVPAGTVPFEQVRQPIIEQLSSEKRQKVINEQVDKLRKTAKVDFLLIFPKETDKAAGSPPADAKPGAAPAAAPAAPGV